MNENVTMDQLISDLFNIKGATPNRVTIGRAMKVIAETIANDPEYAWSWHSNLACASVDEGVPHDVANKAAAKMMYNLFGVDTSDHKHYKAFEFGVKKTQVEAPEAEDFTDFSHYADGLKDLSENLKRFQEVCLALKKEAARYRINLSVETIIS